MSALSTNLPSLNQKPLSRSRALYLGTSIFLSQANQYDESKLTLADLQKTIAERYPVDGSQFSKGVETWLSIFTNGLQMEHSASSENNLISALFYYPIKSLVYCGALRFINDPTGKFVPLDTEVAQSKKNSINPALFVVLLKGVDSSTKNDIIEANVFVVGTKEISLGLVESCQQAYMKSKISRNEFYKKYGNIPVVFCLKNDLLNKKDKRIVVKHFDLNGYFYATENTDIDFWQLFELPTDHLETVNIKKQPSVTTYDDKFLDFIDDYKTSNTNNRSGYIDPYEKSENLVRVEKRIDSETGQNIYVRYLQENADQKISNESLMNLSNSRYPTTVLRDEKTPSPIVYERYIKKKAPQVIIKEIHVEEPAPPPIKYVQKSYNTYHNQMIVGQNKDRPVGSTPEIKHSEEIISGKIEKKNEISEKKEPKSIHSTTKKSSSSSPANNKIYTSIQPELPSRRSKENNPDSSPANKFQPIYSGVEHITTHNEKNSYKKEPKISHVDKTQSYQHPYHKGSSPQTDQNSYNGHSAYMDNNFHINPYSSINQKSRHTGVDDRRPSNNHINKYDGHQNYYSRTTYRNEPKDYKYDSMTERKKKIYVVHENELDLLKAKLRATHKNKKIVVVDESDIDALKESIFGHKEQHRSSRNYHSRHYK